MDARSESERVDAAVALLGNARTVAAELRAAGRHGAAYTLLSLVDLCEGLASSVAHAAGRNHVSEACDGCEGVERSLELGRRVAAEREGRKPVVGPGSDEDLAAGMLARCPSAELLPGNLWSVADGHGCGWCEMASKLRPVFVRMPKLAGGGGA